MRNFRARCYDETEQIEFALNDINTAIKLESQNSEFYFKKAEILQKQKALEYLNKGTEIIKNSDKLYFERGMIYCDYYNDYNRAVVDIDKAIELKNDVARYYHYCGYSYDAESWNDRGCINRSYFKNFNEAH